MLAFADKASVATCCIDCWVVMVAELLAPAAIPPLLIHRAEQRLLLLAEMVVDKVQHAEQKSLLQHVTHVQPLLAQAAALKLVAALCAALQFLTSSRA